MESRKTGLSFTPFSYQMLPCKNPSVFCSCRRTLGVEDSALLEFRDPGERDPADFRLAPEKGRGVVETVMDAGEASTDAVMDVIN